MKDREEFQRVLRQRSLLSEESCKKSDFANQSTESEKDEKNEIDAYLDSLFHSRPKGSMQEKFDFSEVMVEVVDLLGRNFAHYYTGNEMDRGTQGRKLAIKILYYPAASISFEEEMIIESCSEIVKEVKKMIKDCIMKKQIKEHF